MYGQCFLLFFRVSFWSKNGANNKKHVLTNKNGV
jgi:hypothetical protein